MSSPDDSVSMRQRRPIKLCEGWLEHKGLSPQGSAYVPLWLVLKGNVIYLFKNDNTHVDNAVKIPRCVVRDGHLLVGWGELKQQVGNLTIDAHTSLSKRGESKKGYKFDLITDQRVNRFKSRKSAEVELWRGYILGIAQGKIPNDLDLLQSQIEKIQRDVDAYIAPSKNRESMISKDSGVETIDVQSRQSFSGSASVGSSSEERSLDNGGPTMVHKFYCDRSRKQTPPGWFISQCSRQLAEKILETRIEYGNTLMRESTTHLSNGSYVISKRVYISEKQSGFEHYEVMRTMNGYRLNVENPHEPMRSLSEVMEYFVRTSGGSSRPLTTNDLNTLGLIVPDYDRLIPSSTPGQPWSWPPAYEDKHTTPTQTDMTSPRTVTPGILRNIHRQGPSKQVEFKHSDRHTVIGSSIRTRHEAPSNDEFIYRKNADEQLKNLNNVLTDFETTRSYVNDPEFFTEARESGPKRDSVAAIPSAPPPPRPCKVATPSYVNEDEKHSRKNTLDRLPLAPPPPQDPIHEKHSRKNTLDRLPVAPPPPQDPIRTPKQTFQQTKVATPPVNTNPAHRQRRQTESDLRLTHGGASDSPVKSRQRISEHVQTPLTTQTSARPVSSVTPTSPKGKPIIQNQLVKPPLNKSASDGQFESYPSTWSPSSFPQWKRNAKQKTSSAQPSMTTPPSPSPDAQSGVDDAVQRGVNTLCSRFENITTDESKTAVLHRKGRVRSAITDMDGIYDDTAVDRGTIRSDEAMQHSVGSPKQTKVTTPPVNTGHRRQTEPDLRLTHESASGLRLDFKNRLEGLFAGSNTPSTPMKSPLAKKPLSQADFEDDLEHMYDEVPQIPPDEVTYLTDLPTDVTYINSF